jgi:hypothetical protein
MSDTLSEPVLTADDRAFFEKNGYVVVPQVVPQENCDAVIDDIYRFLEMDPHDRSTWYPIERRGTLAHIHQTQSLWDNRQHPRIHRAFADLYGTEKLWVSFDRASMKPPIDPNYPHYQDNGFVHWDMDTRDLSGPLFVQGVLVLADTAENQGGFCCIPGFIGEILTDWIARQPADRNPVAPDLSTLPDGYQVTPIPGKAGDLVIWDRRLAHGNGRNEAETPRLCQYLTMYHASDDAGQRTERIACWREHTAPPYWEKDIPAPYKGKEATLWPEPATLTALGRKVLGADPWE